MATLLSLRLLPGDSRRSAACFVLGKTKRAKRSPSWGQRAFFPEKGGKAGKTAGAFPQAVEDSLAANGVRNERREETVLTAAGAESSPGAHSDREKATRPGLASAHPTKGLWPFAGTPDDLGLENALRAF